MQIFKNKIIDVNDNLREAVENAEFGDRILVADLPKDEEIQWFSVTNLGAYMVTIKGNIYHNNTKIDFPINVTEHRYWREKISIDEKKFTFHYYNNDVFTSFNFQPAQKDKEKIAKTKSNKNTWHKKFKIPANISLENSFETQYGTVIFKNHPNGEISFLDKKGKEIGLDKEYIYKILYAKKDGIVIWKRENLEQGTFITNIFFLYDEILSEKDFYPRPLPPNFSNGLSLKDIMFFDERGRMQIGNRKNNQLWFIMKEEDEK